MSAVAVPPEVRSCRYCAIRPGVRDEPVLLRLPEPPEFRCPRAAVDPADERGQVSGVAEKGVDRRLREVRVTAQPAADYAYAHEHVLTE